TIDGISWYKKIDLKNTLDVRIRRLLYGETDIYSQQICESIKDKAMKTVNEYEYYFGNRLNKITQNSDLNKFNKYINDKNSQKSSSFIKFKDNFSNSDDSLLSIDYLQSVDNELNEKPFIMKNYMSRKENRSSSIFKNFKKLDAKFERLVEKLLLNFNNMGFIHTDNVLFFQ
ncbi:hypothetical protein PMALA_066160, partial [Plasmodium malariae]